MNQQPPEHLTTSPRILNTDFDQNEDRILINAINSKRQFFKTEVNYSQSFFLSQNYKPQPFYESNQMSIQSHDKMKGNSDKKTNFKEINFSKKKERKKSNQQIQMSQDLKQSNLNPKINNLNESCGMKESQTSKIEKYTDENQLYTIANTKLHMKKTIPKSKGGDGFNWLNLKKRLESLKTLLRNLELSSMIYLQSKMNLDHLMIINDIGSNQQFDKNKTKFFDELVSLENYFVKLSQFFYQIFKYFPSISSTLLVVIFFKIILAAELMYQIFILPLMVSFPTNGANIFSSDHEVLRIVFTLPFIFEIVLNFNMKFFEHGEQISDKAQIILRYARNDLWWDVAGVIGTGLVQEDTHLVIILLIFLIRFMKFKAMYNAIEEKFQLSLRFTVAFTLINLFLSISVLAHVCGCIFQWIGIELHNRGQVTWLDKTELINQPILDRYIASLYFSFITMISVGYGDITPINNTERIFVTFMTVFSCGTFAYVVNTIGALFEQLARSQAEYRQQKYEISNYMQNRQIDSELQTKVFQYLEMLKIKKQQEPSSGQRVLEIMNPKLRESIYQNYYGKFLKDWKVFSKQFSPEFLDLLSIQCKELIFGPGETIYYQQEHDLEFSEDGGIQYNQSSQSIFLIIKGKVELFQERRSFRTSKRQQMNTKTKYTDGECFGVKEFFCGLPYEFTAQSKGLTTVMKIQRSHMLDVLKRFPKDYVIQQYLLDCMHGSIIFQILKQETYSMIRDELTFIDPDKYIKCQPCQRYDHTLYQCPQLHYLKRKQLTIFKYIHSVEQERNQTKNKRRKEKQNALGSNITQIKQDLKLLRVNLIINLKKQAFQEEKQRQALLNIISQDSVNIANKKKIISQDSVNAAANKYLNQQSQLQHEESSDSDSDSSLSINDSHNKKQFKKQNTKLLTNEEKELIENSNEGQDELFYFKCPLLTWDEDKKIYILSNEQDDSEGNLAIMAYIEQNFQSCFGNSEFSRMDQHQYGNDLNVKQNFILGDSNESRMTIFQQSPSQINQNKQSFQLTKISNKSYNALPNIIEEDNLIQISSNSLDDFVSTIYKDQIQQAQQLEQNQNIIQFKNNEGYNIQSNRQNNNNNVFRNDSDELIKTTQIYTNVQGFIDNNTSNQKQVSPQFQPQFQIADQMLQNNLLNNQFKNDTIQEAKMNQNSNQPQQEKRLSRTSKHYKTFKQLKTLLSMNLDSSNKQRDSKIKHSGGDHADEDLNHKRTKTITPQHSIDGRIVLHQILNENQIMSNKQDESKQQYSNQQQMPRQGLLYQQGQDENSQNLQKQNNPTSTQNIILKSDQLHNLNYLTNQSNAIEEFLSFMFSFEKFYNFSRYYPKGNMKNVLIRYIKYQDKFAFSINKQTLKQRTGQLVTPRTPQYKKAQNQMKGSSRFSKKL